RRGCTRSRTERGRARAGQARTYCLTRPMALTDPAKRLGAIPPYKFAELQKQVADRRAAGIDVINLGIGDPDHPTFPHVVEAMQAAVADPGRAGSPRSGSGRRRNRRARSRYDT